jgi:hypothetical protein
MYVRALIRLFMADIMSTNRLWMRNLRLGQESEANFRVALGTGEVFESDPMTPQTPNLGVGWEMALWNHSFSQILANACQVIWAVAGGIWYFWGAWGRNLQAA